MWEPVLKELFSQLQVSSPCSATYSGRASSTDTVTCKKICYNHGTQHRSDTRVKWGIESDRFLMRWGKDVLTYIFGSTWPACWDGTFVEKNPMNSKQLTQIFSSKFGKLIQVNI